MQSQDASPVKRGVYLQYPRHGCGEEHESKQRFQWDGYTERCRRGHDIAEAERPHGDQRQVKRIDQIVAVSGIKSLLINNTLISGWV